MERLGMQEEELLDLASDMKDIVQKIEAAREKYKLESLSVSTNKFGGSIMAHEHIDNSDIVTAVTEIDYMKNITTVKAPAYFDANNKIIGD